MPPNQKLKFIPQEHTDYIFRVESKNPVVRFVASLVTPVALVLIRLWFWVKYRRH
jgi:cell division protein FtsW (lipid II flippase)